MKPRFLFALLAATGLAAPGQLAAQQGRPTVQRDWSQSVAITADGGFRMGNPDAPVKLVEYGSLTCSHCAHFAHEAMTPLLANYVRSGRVSFEYRNFVLNGIDVAASLLARCTAPANFFGFVDTLYATQPEWVGRISGLSQAEKARLRGLPDGERLPALAEAGGLTRLAAQAGVTPQRARQCLTGEAEMGQLDRLLQAGEALGVRGTPTFLLNGTRLEVNTWPEIETLLRQAAG